MSLKPAQQLRSERTQERILAATEALLAEQGIEPLTMEQIAERAHVAVGTLYKRFQGKHSLLPLVLERVQARHVARLREFLALPAPQDLAWRCRELLLRFTEEQRRSQRLIRSLFVGHLQTPPTAAAAAHSLELLALLRDWLGECRAEVRHPQPELAISLGQGLVLQALQTAILFERVPGGLSFEAYRDEMGLLLLRYLGAESRG